MTHLNTKPRIIALLPFCAPMLLLTGCRAKQLGATVSDTQSTHVDRTWIAAARRCWPALADSSDKTMSAALADPIHFRSTFSAYAPLSDADIETITAQPLSAAPDPDLSILRRANGPVLTRSQALAAAAPPSQSASSHHDSTDLPADALCTVHDGTPIGFK